MCQAQPRDLFKAMGSVLAVACSDKGGLIGEVLQTAGRSRLCMDTATSSRLNLSISMTTASIASKMFRHCTACSSGISWQVPRQCSAAWMLLGECGPSGRPSTGVQAYSARPVNIKKYPTHRPFSIWAAIRGYKFYTASLTEPVSRAATAIHGSEHYGGHDELIAADSMMQAANQARWREKWYERRSYIKPKVKRNRAWIRGVVRQKHRNFNYRLRWALKSMTRHGSVDCWCLVSLGTSSVSTEAACTLDVLCTVSHKQPVFSVACTCLCVLHTASLGNGADMHITAFPVFSTHGGLQRVVCTGYCS
jgi:hypothetical protein